MAEFEAESTRRSFLMATAGGAAALAGGSVIAACGGGGEVAATTTGASKPSGPVARGGTLTVGTIGAGSNETLNLPLLETNTDFLRVSAIYEGLWELGGPKFGVYPRLVESWETNSDATLFTLKLRSGVTWHDGKPFTADDVVWTVKLWQKGNPSVSALVGPFIDYAGVRKRDSLTVEIPLTKGLVDLPTILSIDWGSYIIQNGTKYGSHTHIGTGPFKLDSFVPGNCVMSAYKDYWGGVPYVDTLVSNSSFTTETARYNALLAGDIDVLLTIPFGLINSAKSNSSIKILESPAPQYVSPFVRTDQAPFSDARVVQALKYLVDRPAILESVFGNNGVVEYDLGMYGVQYYDYSLERPRDVERAKSLLKAAGAEDLAFTCYTSDYTDGAVGVPTIMAQQFAEGGVKMNVQMLETSQQYASTGPHPYLKRTSSTNDWLPNPLSGFYLLGFYTGAPYNDSHFGNPEWDTLLFDALKETDEGKAADKYKALQEIFFNTCGYIVPVNNNFVDAMSQNVQGVTTTPNGTANNFDFRKAWKRA